jgi:hypothetical protein
MRLTILLAAVLAALTAAALTALAAAALLAALLTTLTSGLLILLAGLLLLAALLARILILVLIGHGSTPLGGKIPRKENKWASLRVPGSEEFKDSTAPISGSPKPSKSPEYR